MAEVNDENNKSVKVTPIPEVGSNGGVRAGAGRPKGQMTDEVKLRNRALRNYRVRVTKLTDKLLNAQLTLALGTAYLIRVDIVNKGQKNERREHVIVTDPNEILQYFNEETDKDTYYYISTKEPDVRAIRDILERTYGKPEQAVDISSKGEEIKIVLGTGVKLEEDKPDEPDNNPGNTES